MSLRSEACRTYLEAAEVTCRESDALAVAIEELQSTVWLEVLAWHELVDDVCSLESRVHAFVTEHAA